MDARTSSWAYASLLTGGLLILMGGIVRGWMMAALPDGFTGMMGYGMMMGSWSGTSGGFASWMGWTMGVIGVVAGSLVLFAAYRLRADPASAASSGTLAIVGGALSLLAMGGWIVGAVLAIVGGALCLGNKPTATPA